MVFEGADPLVLAATNWVEEMKSLETGLPLIEPANLLEVRYEKLLENPLNEIGRMVEFMGLGASLPDAYRALIESLQLKPRDETWLKAWSPTDKRRVLDIQLEVLNRWGYVPAIPSQSN
jgi:hypothetical protein